MNRVHFIGIGGIGMSALARLLHHEKKVISGSDRTVSPITCGLEALGIEVYDRQVPENITDDIDLVIYTEAMPKDHPELVTAEGKGIKCVNYFEALGMAVNRYYLIAVAGTHGKTTTTAMLTDILETAELDPTAIIGSLRAKTGSNFRAGKSKYAVVEACEYRRDFMHLQPDVLIITNIEYDHVDCFHDLADVQAAFRELARMVPEDGAIVTDPGNQNIAPVLEGVQAAVVDYTKQLDPLLKLTQPGLHNQMNAAAARAAAARVGVAEDVAEKALSEFAGVWRRFEYKGELNLPAQAGGVPVYDDYAHHPTEIAATIAAARERFPGKNVTVVFQPHMYSRTHELFDGFVSALSKADRVILLPIYAAREENESGVSSERLAERIREANPNVEYVETFDGAAEKITGTVTSNDVIVVMGAGTITELATTLTK